MTSVAVFPVRRDDGDDAFLRREIGARSAEAAPPLHKDGDTEGEDVAPPGKGKKIHAWEVDRHEHELREIGEKELERDYLIKRESIRRTLSESDLSKLDSVERSVGEKISTRIDRRLVAESSVDRTVADHELSPSSPRPGDPLLGELAQNHQQALSDHVTRLPRTAKAWLQQKWLQNVIVVILTVGATELVEFLIGLARGKPVEGLTPEEEQALRQELERWRKLPEPEFWTRMGSVVVALKLSIEEEMYLNQLTRAICEPADSFTWPDGDSASKRVETLLDKHLQQTRGDEIYQHMASKEWFVRDGGSGEPKPPPRIISADVLGLTLGRIITLHNLQKKASG